MELTEVILAVSGRGMDLLGEKHRKLYEEAKEAVRGKGRDEGEEA